MGTADVLGSTFYLACDVLVRVFYALGDGQTPFYISLAAIVANAALDWLLVCFGGFRSLWQVSSYSTWMRIANTVMELPSAF